MAAQTDSPRFFLEILQGRRITAASVHKGPLVPHVIGWRTHKLWRSKHCGGSKPSAQEIGGDPGAWPALVSFSGGRAQIPLT